MLLETRRRQKSVAGLRTVAGAAWVWTDGAAACIASPPVSVVGPGGLRGVRGQALVERGLGLTVAALLRPTLGGFSRPQAALRRLPALNGSRGEVDGNRREGEEGRSSGGNDP